MVVSCLLHENEHSGWLAVQQYLKPVFEGKKELPRDLLLLIGNVKAASANKRHLDGEPDYNRIWDRKTRPEENALVSQVLSKIVQSETFALVDIHNNTGLNPHYGCISSLEKDHLYLASLFSRTAVYFARPEGAFSVVNSCHFPSIALECGISGKEAGTKHACDMVDAVLRLEHFPESKVHPQDLDLFETFATMRIKVGVDFGFEPNDKVELLFRSDLDSLNFQVVPKGTNLGVLALGGGMPLELLDHKGQACDPWSYFDIENRALVTKCDLIPAMLTLDMDVIRKDCLGYLMVNKNF